MSVDNNRDGTHGDESGRAEPGSGNGAWSDDPLQDIVERTRQDASAFFRDEITVAAAWRLRQRNPAAWNDLRRNLKSVGCPLGELDRVLKDYSKIERERLRQAASGSDGLPTGYVQVDNGICRIEVDNEGRLRRIPLCDAFNPLSSARDTAGDNWGTRIEFKAQDGRTKQVALSRGSMLSEPGEVLRQLGDAGFHIADTDPATRFAVVDLIHRWRPQAFVTAVDRLGWANDCTCFVFGDGTVLGNKDGEEFVFQPRRKSSLCSEIRGEGTLEHWQSSVAALAVGNPVLMLAISLAFVGPLLELLGLDGFGIHLRGRSSRGKTTVLHAAASVWGSSKIVMTWRATANGLEGNAALFNSSLFVVDEIGQVDGREVATAIYMLASGRGKSRADRSGAARLPAQWTTPVLSSGEIGLVDKVAEAGRVVKAGQEIRLLDLPVTDRTHGVFDDLHDAADPAGFANHLRDQAARSFGTAGQAFVAKLLDDSDCRDRIARHLDEFRAVVRFDRDLADDEGQGRRAVDIFGLVAAAGELATSYGITGWREGVSLRAAFQLLTLWVDTRGGTGDREAIEALNRTQEFLNAHSEDRFVKIMDRSGIAEADTEGMDLTYGESSVRGTHGKAGWKDKGGFWILPAAWRDIHIGSDSAMAARVLHERDLLISDKRTLGDRHLTRKTPRGVEGRPRCYFIRREILGMDFTNGGNGDDD